MLPEYERAIEVSIDRIFQVIDADAQVARQLKAADRSEAEEQVAEANREAVTDITGAADFMLESNIGMRCVAAQRIQNN